MACVYDCLGLSVVLDDTIMGLFLYVIVYCIDHLRFIVMSMHVCVSFSTLPTFLPARRYASAGNSDRNVSVCPSVTRRFFVKTKKARGMISSPSGSPKTLVF